MLAMTTSSPIDFDAAWAQIIREFRGDPDSIHGPPHWRRVEQNGLKIAASNGASVDVVRLFAALHDSCRQDDSFELHHGELAAQYALVLRGKLFDLDDDSFELLQHACKWHTHGKVSTDPTIGACWDADRLDLTRVGIEPSHRFMSTELGKRLCSSRPKLCSDG
jgi:uncharacterized protein